MEGGDLPQVWFSMLEREPAETQPDFGLQHLPKICCLAQLAPMLQYLEYKRWEEGANYYIR
jgi:hypothetical protein